MQLQFQQKFELENSQYIIFFLELIKKNLQMFKATLNY